MKFLVKFDLEFDLKFEISDGKNLVKFWGRTFLPARKALKISGRISGRISEQISEQISETSFQISRLFSETSFSRRAVLISLLFSFSDSPWIFFCAFFLPFPRILGVPRRGKLLLFFGFSLAFFQKKRGLEGHGNDNKISDNKIATFRNFIVRNFAGKKKQRFWTIFRKFSPPRPPPKRKFFTNIVVSACLSKRGEIV